MERNTNWTPATLLKIRDLQKHSFGISLLTSPIRKYLTAEKQEQLGGRAVRVEANLPGTSSVIA